MKLSRNCFYDQNKGIAETKFVSTANPAGLILIILGEDPYTLISHNNLK